MFEVYRLYDTKGALLYVGRSQRAAARLVMHRKLQPWAARIARMETESFKNRKAAERAERAANRGEFPLFDKYATGHRKPGELDATITIRIPAAVKARLEALARADRNRPVSSYVANLIADHIVGQP